MQTPVIGSTGGRPQRVVCVLGMHRSGTSVLTRILNLLGVSLGPEEHLMQADKFNPKGFWEHDGIVKLNDELLERLGGTWRFLPAFRPGWEHDPALDDLKERARALVQYDFAQLELWGWKDPRACVTLPFWIRVMPPMQHVLCFRNPLDCARSMEHTMSIETGVAIWHRYVVESIRHARGRPGTWLFYEDLMEDWRVEVTRLADGLGLGERARRADVLKSVAGFMDAELYHHRTRAGDVLDDPRVSFAAKSLYLCVRQRVNTDRLGAGAKTTPRDRETMEAAVASLAEQSLADAPASPQVHNGVEAPVDWTGGI